MAGDMFFGTLYTSNLPGGSTNGGTAQMSVVPAPATNMTANAEGYSELLTFENGGADVVQSAQTHRTYEMEFNTRDGSKLDIIRAYKQKQFGSGLIYFADPMNYSTNLLPPAWASPGLVEQGWKTITSETAVSFIDTPGNGWNQPKRAMYITAFTGAANAVPNKANQIAVVPIHPDYTLYVGADFTATGSAVIRVRPINLDGSYGSVTTLTSLPYNNALRMNASFAGNTYKAVEMYISRTALTASTLTIFSAMAQLWPTVLAAPNLSGNHIPGAGNTGCKFTSEAIVETYVQVDAQGGTRHLKSMSVDLTEVGAWQI